MKAKKPNRQNRNKIKKSSSQQPRGTFNTKDVNARTVFQNPVMCCQFLKEYSGIEIFKDIKPENIIDETKKYQAYLGIELESDTVKKVILDSNESNTLPVFLVSLIEHKSNVDYNISMQLLRYMVCIWNEYGKDMLEQDMGNPANKGFLYPAIIPIVYYEGNAKWTVGLNLKDRIHMSDIFAEYIPDFTYKLVCNYNYSNEELLSRDDAMSLFMLLNKVQTAEDLSEFLRLDDSKLSEILKKSPKHTINVIAGALWGLCMKLNIPQNEAKDYVGKVWERDMGYLFANMEKMDIQQERRNTAEARQEAKNAKRDAENALKELQDEKARSNRLESELKSTELQLAELKQKLATAELKLSSQENK